MKHLALTTKQYEAVHTLKYVRLFDLLTRYFQNTKTVGSTQVKGGVQYEKEMYRHKKIKFAPDAHVFFRKAGVGNFLFFMS